MGYTSEDANGDTGPQEREQAIIAADEDMSEFEDFWRYEKPRISRIADRLQKPDAVPLCAIIRAMHHVNHEIRETAKGDNRLGAAMRDSMIISNTDDLMNSILQEVAGAATGDDTIDTTITRIGRLLYNPSDREGERLIDEEHQKCGRKPSPFPWNDGSAEQAALAIPEAARIPIRPILERVAGLNQWLDRENYDSGADYDDIPGMLPIAVSKGFSPDRHLTTTTMDTLLMLKGDWRDEIADAVADDPHNRNLLTYAQINPDGYSADWISAIIRHIGDEDLCNAGMFDGEYNENDGLYLRYIMDSHIFYRGESVDGSHPRLSDVESLTTKTEFRGGTVWGLKPPRDRRDPAAVETVLRIFDAMSLDAVNHIREQRERIGRQRLMSLFRRAVHDAGEYPYSYVGETLSARIHMETEQ